MVFGSENPHRKVLIFRIPQTELDQLSKTEKSHKFFGFAEYDEKLGRCFPVTLDTNEWLRIFKLRNSLKKLHNMWYCGETSNI